MIPETTICILSYMRFDKLEACLSSIEAAGDPCRVLVLDSSPREHQQDAAAVSSRHGASFIGWPDAVNCNYGRRELLQHVETPWMVYLDDDMTVPAGWLTKLHGRIEEFKADVAVMRWVDDISSVEYSGGRVMIRGGIQCYPFGHVGPVSFCAGGATMYRTQLMRQTEYRSEFTGCGEDHDQTIQINKLGGRLIQADVTCRHYHADNSVLFTEQRFRNKDIVDSQLALIRTHSHMHHITNILKRSSGTGVKLNGNQKSQLREAVDKWLKEL